MFSTYGLKNLSSKTFNNFVRHCPLKVILIYTNEQFSAEISGSITACHRLTFNYLLNTFKRLLPHLFDQQNALPMSFLSVHPKIRIERNAIRIAEGAKHLSDTLWLKAG